MLFTIGSRIRQCDSSFKEIHNNIICLLSSYKCSKTIPVRDE
nr:MAG TPA: hypothetical protein [Caudoviricetes sp.]